MSNVAIDHALQQLGVEEKRLMSQGVPDGKGGATCDHRLAPVILQTRMCQALLIGMREIVLAIDRGNE